jgi:hypothetical protein
MTDAGFLDTSVCNGFDDCCGLFIKASAYTKKK